MRFVLIFIAGSACGGMACGEPAVPLQPLMDAAVEEDAGQPVGDAGQNAGPTFVNAWGGYGTEPGQFIEPSSIELSSTGVVIVAGHEDRIQTFTAAGELLEIFGHRGQGDGEFNHPHGLAVDRFREDLIYVGDQENHRLQVFTSTGGFVRRWGDAGFQHIHDIGIDHTSGDVFVPDYELHTVRRFSATGELLESFGGEGAEPGRFNGAWGLSTDSAGYLYVADTFNRRVQKLDSSGGFVGGWGGFGNDAFIKPTGVFVDRDDVVYVCDSLAQRVGLFDTEGSLIEVWDLEAIYGERSEPEDIVLSPNGEDIFIAEVFRHRVLHLAR